MDPNWILFAFDFTPDIEIELFELSWIVTHGWKCYYEFLLRCRWAGPGLTALCTPKCCLFIDKHDRRSHFVKNEPGKPIYVHFFFSSDTNERNLSIEMGNEIQTCKITELKMIHTFSGGNTHATFEREMDGKQSSWFCSRKILSFIFVSSGFYFLVEYRNDVRKNGKCSGLVHSFSVHSSILLLCVFDWMPPKKRKECCENVLSIIRFVLVRTHSHASIREWMRRMYRRDGVWHAFKSNAVAGEKKMGRDS